MSDQTAQPDSTMLSRGGLGGASRQGSRVGVSRRGLLHAAGASAAVAGGGGLLEACSSSVEGPSHGSTSGRPSGLVIGPSGDTTGVTDTAKINAVIQDAGTAFLGSGTYYVSNLLPDSYGAINGVGPATILQAVAGTTGYMIALKNPSSTQQVYLRDIVLQPNVGSLGGVRLDNTGFSASSSPVHMLENVHVIGARSYSYYFDNNARGLRLMNCLAFNGYGGDGFYLGIGCTDSIFVGCSSGPVSGHGFNVGGWNNMFTVCKAFYAGFNGSTFNTTSCGFEQASCRNNTLVGCSAQNNALHGFDLQSTVNCTVTGCEADGNNQGGSGGVGINTSSAVNCSVVGNTGSNISGNAQAYGIQVAGKQTGTTFLGNTLSGTDGILHRVSGYDYLYVDSSSADFSGLTFFGIPSPILFPASPQALRNSSTITVSSNAAIPVTATANLTGLILQAPPNAWSQVTIVNRSAYTLTFAAAQTSNVADGTSDVIPALASRVFVYDGNTSLWYRTG